MRTRRTYRVACSEVHAACRSRVDDELGIRARGHAHAPAVARRSPEGRRLPPRALQAGERPESEASTPLPPRSGSRRRHTTAASAKAGSARMTNAARQESCGDVAGDGESDAGAEVLAREDDAVDPAALPAAEPVADERGDHRPGGGGDRAEEETRREEARRSSRRWRSRASLRPRGRSSRPSTRVRRTRSARTPNGSVASAPTRELTATSRPMSVFVMCRSLIEHRRGGADRRGVGAAEPEDRGEDDDHARALLAAERDRQPAREGARRGRAEGRCVRQDLGFARLIRAHAPMVAGVARWA